MSRSGVLLLGLLLGLSCQHARDIERHEAPEERPRAAAPRAPAPRSEVKRPAAPGRPELATNASGLMKPEGPMKIQKRLADEGYLSGALSGQLDEPTATALRKFQADHDLARTGAPDRDTLKALGLSEADVWRSQQQREQEELKERKQRYDEGKPVPQS